MNTALGFERLEDRMLLAVTVTLGAKKGILTITGDADSDTVDIEGEGTSGLVEVFVNGGSVGTFAGVKTIRANMGAGDDTIFISAVHIGGAVVLNMGAGADEVDFDDNRGIQGGSVETLIGGALLIYMGGNAGDFVEMDNIGGFGIEIGNNLLIAGAADVDLDGDGGGAGNQAADINIGGFLKISLNGSGDVGGNSADLFMDDVNVLGTTIINGSASGDLIRIEESNFVRRVEINLKGGDDLLDLDQSGINRFNAATVFAGGAGFDTLDRDAGNIFVIAPVEKGFEAFA